MAAMLRLFCVLAVLMWALIGVLGVMGVLAQDQIWDIGGKTSLILLILAGAGSAITALASPKRPVNNEKDSKQGPQF